MINKQTVSRTHIRKNEEKLTLTNEINCGGIGTFKLHTIHVILKFPPNISVYDVTI